MPPSVAPEGNEFFLGRVEGLNSARVPAFADLQGVMSGFDWHLDRFVPFDQPGTLTVDHDIERAAHDPRGVQE